VTATAVVAVLAGGRSRRMGTAKATVALGGRPLVAWPLDAAARAGLEAVVVAKPGSELPELAVPVWLEPATPSHPLAGLVCAIERAGGRAVVAVACDMPFVAPALLARLAAIDATAAAPRIGGRLEPFPGRYEAATLPVLRAALDRQAAVRQALAALAPAELGEAELRALGDPARMVASVNTPAELAAAERSLAKVDDRMPPSAEQWIEAYAEALGRPAPTQAETAKLLQLASVAAHASERRAAPIACWLLATTGLSLDEALVLARELEVDSA
jgi:molybdopterin-guanine dinucleotide biosynthesis protein A